MAHIRYLRAVIRSNILLELTLVRLSIQLTTIGLVQNKRDSINP
jgi:hypothetical protein